MTCAKPLNVKQLLILVAVLIGIGGQNPTLALPAADHAPSMHAIHHAAVHRHEALAAGLHGDGHQCLGCAAAYAALPAVIAPLAIAVPVRRVPAMKRLRGMSGGPATPPPRLA